MAFMDFLSKIGVILGVYPEEAPADDGMPGYDEEYPAEDYYQQQPAGMRQETVAAPQPIRTNMGMGGRRAAAPVYEPEEEQSAYTPRKTSPVRDNVVPMTPRQDAEARKHSEMIVCVRRLEDSQTIINALLDGRSLLLNLEEIDDTQRQRVIDMLGGAAFALRGKMIRVSHRTYLLAPSTVDVVNSTEMLRTPAAGPASGGEFNPAYRM